MSNNNNGRNYKKVEHGVDNEMETLLNSSNQPQHAIGNNMMTTINIENDLAAGTSQQHIQRHHQLNQTRREIDATRINMEANVNAQSSNAGESQNVDDRQRMPNFLALLREARQQFNRSQSLRDSNPSRNSTNAHSRSWRENLYEVLSSPVSPRAHTNVLRAIFTPSSNVRYDSFHTNVLVPDDQFRFMFNIGHVEGELQPSLRSQHTNGLETQPSSAVISRQNSRLTEDMGLNDNSTSEAQAASIDISIDNNDVVNGNNIGHSITPNSLTNIGRQPQRQTLADSTTAPTVDMIDDADTNAVGEMIVKFVTHFIRYLPFIFIIFVKFIHDHLLGILDILVLQGVVCQLNKSIKDQVAKLNQKIFSVLVRDLILVVCVAVYRFILSTSTPDPFGLLINPPEAVTTLDLFSTQKIDRTNGVSTNTAINPFGNAVPSFATANSLSSTISATKSLSLGTLLYYVAVNDLLLKLITQLIKIIVTMFPSKVIRHKSRARLYALIENSSQFYRAVVPIRQWLKFLFESYTGFEVISGILFSLFYMGAKLFELFERGKPLRNSVVNFLRNMDYDRKPTKEELEAASTVCPICHDSYSSPVILECSHIFCDECVNTWFKREQTCPMCRAKVSENPAWQDGATTYFYQLC